MYETERERETELLSRAGKHIEQLDPLYILSEEC